jgi:hypothetical protein
VLRGDAATPFDVDAPADAAASLDAAIGSALTRWRQGRLTVTDPLAALTYDPSVDTHLDVLLGWAARLRAARQAA